MMSYYTFITIVLLLLYIFFDVNYFVRMVLTIGWSRLLNKRKHILEKSVIYGVCLTSDIDIFLKHMNNARYLRELDFARNCFYDSTGIFAEIRRKGGSIFQTATSIRYRRPIPIFSMYKITTQIVYWDEKSIYVEHEFVRLSDDFVLTTALSRQSISGQKLHVPDVIEKIDPQAKRSEPSEELQLWLESLEESSLKFKRRRLDSEKEQKKDSDETEEAGVFSPNPD